MVGEMQKINTKMDYKMKLLTESRNKRISDRMEDQKKVSFFVCKQAKIDNMKKSRADLFENRKASNKNITSNKQQNKVIPNVQQLNNNYEKPPTVAPKPAIPPNPRKKDNFRFGMRRESSVENIKDEQHYKQNLLREKERLIEKERIIKLEKERLQKNFGKSDERKNCGYTNQQQSNQNHQNIGGGGGGSVGVSKIYDKIARKQRVVNDSKEIRNSRGNLRPNLPIKKLDLNGLAGNNYTKRNNEDKDFIHMNYIQSSRSHYNNNNDNAGSISSGNIKRRNRVAITPPPIKQVNFEKGNEPLYIKDLKTGNQRQPVTRRSRNNGVKNYSVENQHYNELKIEELTNESTTNLLKLEQNAKGNRKDIEILINGTDKIMDSYRESVSKEKKYVFFSNKKLSLDNPLASSNLGDININESINMYNITHNDLIGHSPLSSSQNQSSVNQFENIIANYKKDKIDRLKNSRRSLDATHRHSNLKSDSKNTNHNNYFDSQSKLSANDIHNQQNGEIQDTLEK